MNQRVYSLLWLLGTILVFLAGCKTSESAAVTSDNSLLWKIEGKNLKTPSYLMGTIHILPQKDFFLSEVMKQALANTQQVVLELDMDDPAMGMNMLQNASMNDGSTLDKLLSAEDYQKLDVLVKKRSRKALSSSRCRPKGANRPNWPCWEAARSTSISPPRISEWT